MDPSIRDLIDISHYAARHPSWVQGSGGNCSVKAENLMAIKASGYFLEEVGEDKGFVVLDLVSKRAAGGDPNARPSMEFPLHTLLNRFVIHTHPVPVGALVCSQEGKKEFRKIFPESHFIWVDYATPGLQLFLKVRETLAALTPPPQDKVLFLENHGLFAAAETKERCMQLHSQAIERCEKALPAAKAAAEKTTAAGYLTPDHVVFFNLDRKTLSPKQRQALSELEAFAAEVAARVKTRGWSLKALAEQDAQFLLQMEEEKYRQDLWKDKP
ncbi:MAG TPA: class II aldolase/adducin family protein [Verrucomicrobiae bacterium]|jgi:rhamnose utilization protein RhaD (predicted bifunctional aldolase and dehydrogenase)|nr:class II aldolase/adducin family protein [Verrucomicrobiae bacterium]